MGPIDRTVNFVANHAVALVGRNADEFFFDGFGEAWPTCTAFKFAFAVEERRIAADRKVDAVFVIVPVRIAKGRLGALLASDAELLSRQDFFPLVVGFADR